MQNAICEHQFTSMTGEMNLQSTSLADDQLLSTFKLLAQNIHPSDLNKKMMDILSEYPSLCKKLAINV